MLQSQHQRSKVSGHTPAARSEANVTHRGLFCKLCTWLARRAFPIRSGKAMRPSSASTTRLEVLLADAESSTAAGLAPDPSTERS